MLTEPRALIALGGNLGDVLENFRWVLSRFPFLGLDLVAASSAFQTVPLTLDGGTWSPHLGPPAYWNAVVSVKTDLVPHRLLDLLQQLEAEAGRVRRERWESRSLDLDLLGYGDLVIDDAVLTLPHPGLAERRFVLAPMVQVAADWVHPILGVSVETLLERLGVGHGEVLSIDDCWVEGTQQPPS